MTNADVEWKFARAVVADEYRRHHPIVVPFNIITFPISHCYIKKYGDSRAERAKDHRRIYQKFYIEDLFPKITNRYQEKHGEAFPMSVQAKVDHLQKNVNEIMVKLDAILKKEGGEFQLRGQTSMQTSRNLQEAAISYHSAV